jgi:hypothetical protein
MIYPIRSFEKIFDRIRHTIHYDRVSKIDKRMLISSDEIIFVSHFDNSKAYGYISR